MIERDGDDREGEVLFRMFNIPKEICILEKKT
jgi:hypothetical protein